jgi:hypothetical protein
MTIEGCGLGGLLNKTKPKTENINIETNITAIFFKNHTP